MPDLPDDKKLPAKVERESRDLTEPERKELVGERVRTGKVDYDRLLRGIKSTDEEATIARFSIGRNRSQKHPDGKDFGDALLMVDSKGNIGIVGLHEGQEARWSDEQRRNILVNKDNPTQAIDTIDAAYMAVVQPDGSVVGGMPLDLKEALAEIGNEAASITSKFFYGKTLIEGTRQQIEQRKLLEDKSNK